MQLQCLDYADWQASPDSFAAGLVAAFRQEGFALLSNHGVTVALRERSFSAAQAFFALPAETKNAINIQLSPHHRGYFSLGQEKLDMDSCPQGDAKEGLKIGRDLASDHPLVRAGVPLHGANQWPEEELVPGFRQTMQELFVCFQDIATQLMGALALAMGLKRDYFAPMLDQPMATLAPLHYPIQKKHAIGAAEHTDFGCLTLVLQDGMKGLQVWNKTRERWIDVPADPRLLVVNAGDMLQRWSNDNLVSTRHRVINSGERYSFAFFFDPNHNARVAPLPGTCSRAHPPRYRPVTALDYLQQRIDESFSYFRKL